MTAARRRLLAALLLAVLAAGGARILWPDNPDRPPAAVASGHDFDLRRNPTSLAFTEAGSVPLNHPEGGAVSAQIENFGDETVTIRSLRLVTDPGLDATYVGWSICLGGCGTYDWNDAMARRLPGTFPIVLHPRKRIIRPDGSYTEPPLSLVFRMRLRDGDTAAAAVFDRQCLKIRAVMATLTSGKKVRVEYAAGGEYVAGITKPPPTAPSYKRCGQEGLRGS